MPSPDDLKNCWLKIKFLRDTALPIPVVYLEDRGTSEIIKCIYFSDDKEMRDYAVNWISRGAQVFPECSGMYENWQRGLGLRNLIVESHR